MTNIDIVMHEIKDGGVMDVIGGELWDASFLLCAYILSNETDFLIESTLIELGAGLGLPSLLLAKLKQLQGYTSGDIIMTDYDTDVLDNMIQNLQLNFDIPPTCTCDNDIVLSSQSCIQVRHLDWSNFICNLERSISYVKNVQDYNDDDNHDYNDDDDLKLYLHQVNNLCKRKNDHSYVNYSTDYIDLISDINTHENYQSKSSYVITNNIIIPIETPLSMQDTSYSSIHQNDIFLEEFIKIYGTCDYLIGSALCYISSHVSLAHTIKYFFQHTQCQEVIIIQLSSRPGFQEFLTRLSTLKLSYTIDCISNDIYERCKEMTCKHVYNQCIVHFSKAIIRQVIHEKSLSSCTCTTTSTCTDNSAADNDDNAGDDKSVNNTNTNTNTNTNNGDDMNNNIGVTAYLKDHHNNRNDRNDDIYNRIIRHRHDFVILKIKNKR